MKDTVTHYAPDIQTDSGQSIPFTTLSPTANYFRSGFGNTRNYSLLPLHHMSTRRAAKCVFHSKRQLSFLTAKPARGKKRAVEETVTEDDEQGGETSLRNAPRASQSARSREKQPALPVKKRTLRALDSYGSVRSLTE